MTNRLVLPLGFFSSTMLILAAQVPLNVASITVLLVAGSCLAGMRLARWCGFGDGRPLDRVAVGYGLGLFATLAVDQVAVTGLGVVWRWTAPVALTPLAVLEALSLARASQGRRASPSVGLVVAGGALLAIGHEWIWSIPLGGAALATAWIASERGRGARLALQIGLLGASLAGTVVAVVRRDGRWWLTQNDTHFYEAVASSLERWGARDFVLASGRVLHYHWFPYAWVGAIDRATGAEDYVILTRVAPLVATLGILLCVVAIAIRAIPAQRMGWAVLVFAVSPVFGDWWRGIPLAMAGSFSQLFAMTWLLSAPVALLAWLERPRHGRLVVLGMLMLALVGGKANHAVIAAVMIAASWMVLARRRDPRSRPLLFGGALIAFAMAVLGRWLFGGATSLRFLPTDWVPYVQGDVYDWQGASRGLAAVAILAGMIATPLAAIGATRRSHRRNDARSVAIAVLFAGLVLSMFTNRLYNLQPNGLFALHSAITLCWVGSALIVAQGSVTVPTRAWLPATGVGLVVLAVLPNIDSGSRSAIWWRVARSPVALVPIVVVLAGAVALRRPVREMAPVALRACVALALIVQTWLVADSAADDYRQWRSAGPMLALTEADVARWLRDETPADAIIATNHLCASAGCPQPEYSGDSAFAVATERRFFVAAPLFSLNYSGSSRLSDLEGRDRVNAVMEFGSTPSAATAAGLGSVGARWYVAERARSGGVDFSAVGDVRYENADYVVIELRAP